MRTEPTDTLTRDVLYVTSERMCCSLHHWGPVCPDGLVMCCICYGRYLPDELHVDAAGVTWDICDGCGKDLGQ